MKQIFSGVFEHKGKIFTKNLVPGTKVYGEALLKESGVEYREWIPWRSKLGAAIKNSLKKLPLNAGNNVLYLGSSEGTTPSHISDIIGKEGLLFLRRDLFARFPSSQNTLDVRLYGEMDVAKQPGEQSEGYQLDDERPVRPHPTPGPGQQNACHQDDGQIAIAAKRLILENVFQITVGIIIRWYGKTDSLINCQERVEWGSHKEHGY